VSGRHSVDGSSASARMRSPTTAAHGVGRSGDATTRAQGSCAPAPRAVPVITANEAVPAKTNRAKASPIHRQCVPVRLSLSFPPKSSAFTARRFTRPVARWWRRTRDPEPPTESRASGPLRRRFRRLPGRRDTV
jgi:hypothetical protein